MVARYRSNTVISGRVACRIGTILALVFAIFTFASAGAAPSTSIPSDIQVIASSTHADIDCARDHPLTSGHCQTSISWSAYLQSDSSWEIGIPPSQNQLLPRSGTLLTGLHLRPHLQPPRHSTRA